MRQSRFAASTEPGKCYWVPVQSPERFNPNLSLILVRSMYSVLYCAGALLVATYCVKCGLNINVLKGTGSTEPVKCCEMPMQSPARFNPNLWLL